MACRSRRPCNNYVAVEKMNQKEFKDFINAIRPNSNTAAEVWWEWSKELEEYDSPDGKPSLGHKKAEEFLGIFAEHIRKIQETHGNEIAGQIISLAERGACPFPWEIKRTAEHFANGGSIEDVAELEKEGALEDSTDIGLDDGMQLPP